MGVLHGNRDRVEPPGPNLVKSRDPLADPIELRHQLSINALRHGLIVKDDGTKPKT